MDIKTLLGESYKDGMTIEEIDAALANVELTDPSKAVPSVPKATFDKTASEVARLKKELQAKMTEEEAAKLQREQDAAELQEKYESLKKETEIARNKAKFLSLGYDEKLAEQTAAALFSGEYDTVFANQKKHLEMQESAIKAKLLEGTPRPPAGTATQTNYEQAIDEARKKGDQAQIATLIRLQAEEAINKQIE